MSVAASITWIVTALAGATLLGIWLARGGLRQQHVPGVVSLREPLRPVGCSQLAWRGDRCRSDPYFLDQL